MILAIFGSTGQVGTEIVSQALENGDVVHAYARPASASLLPEHPGLTTYTGEPDDEAAIRRCIEGVDAVISALGSRENSPEAVERFGDALQRITSIMRETGVRRLVAISGAGTKLEGDTPNLPRTIIRGIMKIVARHLLAAKQREAEVIQATGLEWVIVRPSRIHDGPPSGTQIESLERPPSPFVTRGDVAAFMLRAAREDRWVRQAPFVGTPR